MGIYNWLMISALVAGIILVFWYILKADSVETKIETTLEILERSYVSGEISIEDYDELKETLNKKHNETYL